MKKPMSIILNILSIISAIITMIFIVFCAYDWVRLASTSFAYTIDFWWVIDYYAVGMMIFAAVTLVFALPNWLINRKGETNEKSKKLSMILSVASAACIVISFVLYLLPFNIGF